ncbi:hypothetical protein SLA2020_287630 [Shorea laevis]
MDAERPHRTTSSGSSTSATSELFICFTSRLSSSSMKIPSKSILSPGRNREPSQISLSSSLSRRLRSNGSMKGGQASPMFPAIGKKRGCAIENPEPSSPKVTCIGQVRVKTKKQGKKIRARSKRRGEVSFRKLEHGGALASTPSTSSLDMGSHQDYNMGHFLHSSSHHHQQSQQQECRKWVHFPVTICEALRSFGADFNCFLPCRSSCMASQREKEKTVGSGGNGDGNGTGSSCGAVFARWLVAVQEGEGKQREIELVVGEEEKRGSTELRSSQRRHIFEDIEISECKDEKMGEEEGRVSICVPPKNALLLMRCRSDPVKMAALANRFWESPAPKDEVQEDEEVDEEAEKVEEEQPTIDEHKMEHEMSELCRKSLSYEAAEETEIPEAEAEAEPEAELALDGKEAEEQEIEESNPAIDNLEREGNTEYQDQENEIENNQEQESAEELPPENFADMEKVKCEENVLTSPENEHNPEEEPDPEAELENVREGTEETTSNEQECTEKEEQGAESQAIAEETEEGETERKSDLGHQDTEEAAGIGSNEKESQQDLLPDCLLLMMCEPKLSMEVSKETWVCSTDFIRCLPERPPAVKKKKDGGGDEPKRRISIDSKPSPKLLQPPRSSCYYPAAPPMAVAASSGRSSTSTTRKQKLAGDKGCEPFVLTRCKSEPMRSATKLAPDACFWKNGKLEPATLGVGAAGVGF